MSDAETLRAALSVDRYRTVDQLRQSLGWGWPRLYPALRELRESGELVDFWDDRNGGVGYYRLRGNVA